MFFPVGWISFLVNSYALGHELAYNAEDKVWANPLFLPLIIINIIKAKAGEGSRVAQFTRIVAREPATSSAGTGFPHDMLGFPRGKFHKDCGAGTGDIQCGNQVPARHVEIPAWHVSQGLWRGNRRHIVREPGSRTTCWDSRVARFTRTVAREPATCCAGTWFPLAATL